MYDINDLLELEGFDSVEELLEEFAMDSTVPGICTHCGNAYYYEPDQYEGWCDTCDAGTVKSALILLGM